MPHRRIWIKQARVSRNAIYMGLAPNAEGNGLGRLPTRRTAIIVGLDSGEAIRDGTLIDLRRKREPHKGPLRPMASDSMCIAAFLFDHLLPVMPQVQRALR